MTTTPATRGKASRRKSGPTFADLVEQFRPAPITSEAAYDRTVEVMNKLAVRDARSRDESDYL